MDSALIPPIRHGGDLQEAEALFGKPSSGWLDLSTGVNADAYPHTGIDASSWQRLPQQESLNKLLATARRYYGVAGTTAIVAAPGSQSLLQDLPTILKRRNVSILGPTYAEHAKTWADAGHDVTIATSIAELNDADIVVVVNPNNPDGRVIAVSTLIDLARRQTKRNGLLIVDEAFADTAPATSILPRLGNEAALVLRSFGKFFGLPGLRLGFAAGDGETVSKLQRQLGPWAVSGPALEIGARALGDDRWVATMRSTLTERSHALNSVLRTAGLAVIGGTSLFRLVDDEQALEVFETLGGAGIFIRRFPENPTWLRFGVPAGDADLQRLEARLTKLHR
jgi:cobalamin biosynthetic protein CobC